MSTKRRPAESLGFDESVAHAVNYELKRFGARPICRNCESWIGHGDIGMYGECVDHGDAIFRRSGESCGWFTAWNSNSEELGTGVLGGD